MKDNKIIAEFMGLYPLSRAGFISDKNHEYYESLSELKYNKSWDWLMPVVEKVIQKDYDFLVFEELKYHLWRVDIDAVYNAVVEFIKEYNN